MLFAGFEIREPVDPIVDRAYVVRVVDGVHERMVVWVIFGGLGTGDTVGRVLGEEDMSAFACLIGQPQFRYPLYEGALQASSLLCVSSDISFGPRSDLRH